MEEPAAKSVHVITILFLLSWRIPLPEAAPVNTTFSFQSSSIETLILLGDAYLCNNSVTLTKSSGVPSSSSGAVACNFPVQFRDPLSGSSASFSTRFTFSLSPSAQLPLSQDSLSFFISPFNQTLLSLFTFSLLFDAFSNTANFLSASYPAPAPALNLSDLNISLRSGAAVTAWLEFHSGEDVLALFLSCSSSKPWRPAISSTFPLSATLNDFMYVGFSASAEGSTELHTLLDWNFHSEFPLSSQPAATSPSGFQPPARKLGLGLPVAVPTAALLFSLLLLVFFIFRRGQREKTLFSEDDSIKRPRRVSYSYLSSITKNFHGSRIIGEGSFGNVYRAMDPSSGAVYAVKRSVSSKGKEEFLSELSIIARLRHKNLLQLVGWCTERDELLLVYEFMANGSLDKILHGRSPELSFSRRWKIVRGIAEALVYLHKECEQQVIHRDIKSSNVLLDEEFNPKVGDFGLAKLMDHDKSPGCTLTAGTMGYLAPEYLQYGKASEKSDVFSFGVLVLEVCCGRRVIDEERGEVNLVDFVWGLHGEDRVLDGVDSGLEEGFDLGEMRRLMMVGLSCVNPNFRERPCMGEVLRVLSFEGEMMVVPKRKPVPVVLYGVPPLALLDQSP